MLLFQHRENISAKFILVCFRTYVRVAWLLEREEYRAILRSNVRLESEKLRGGLKVPQRHSEAPP